MDERHEEKDYHEYYKKKKECLICEDTENITFVNYRGKYLCLDCYYRTPTGFYRINEISEINFIQELKGL